MPEKPPTWLLSEWQPDALTLPPPFECPECGGELTPLGILN